MDDRVRNLLGKLLLREGLIALGYDPYLLYDLQLDKFKRPYISRAFDFNISHSGTYVCCAIASGCQLGVDLEAVQAVDFEEMKAMMTPSEWSSIDASNQPERTFFEYWTLKEAAIKAVGVGFLSDLHLQIKVHGNTIFIADKKWYLRRLDFNKEYAGHLVASKPITICEMHYCSF